MDFQSLNRRELQALCKLNKIPANITNVAMVDALKSLHFVEGIEDFLKPSQSSETNESSIESPEKNEVMSPRVPRTSCRTSTRKKPLRDEAETVKTVTRTTRRGVRRQIAGDVEESKTSNVPETPAVSSSRRRTGPAVTAQRNMETQLTESGMDVKVDDSLDQEKKCVSETPAGVPYSRRKGPAASSQRSNLKEGSVVGRTYSTRRSARLAEVKQAEPTPMEKEMTQSFGDKLDEGSDDFNPVSENSSLSGSGIDALTVGIASQSEFLELEKEKTSTVDTDMGSEETTAIDAKTDVLERSNDMEVDVIPSDLENPSELNKLENLDNFSTDRDLGSEETTPVDIKTEVLQNSGADDTRIDVHLSENENQSEISKLENVENVISYEENLGLVDVAAAEMENGVIPDKGVDNVYPSGTENPSETLKQENVEQVTMFEDIDSDVQTAVEMEVLVLENNVEVVLSHTENPSEEEETNNSSVEEPLDDDMENQGLEMMESDELKLSDSAVMGNGVPDNKGVDNPSDTENPSETLKQEIVEKVDTFEDIDSDVKSATEMEIVVLENNDVEVVSSHSENPSEAEETNNSSAEESLDDDVENQGPAKIESDELSDFEDEDFEFPELHSIEDLKIGFAAKEMSNGSNATSADGETSQESLEFEDIVSDEILGVDVNVDLDGEKVADISKTHSYSVDESVMEISADLSSVLSFTSIPSSEMDTISTQVPSNKTPTKSRRVALVSDDKENIDHSGRKLQLLPKDMGKKIKKDVTEEEQLKKLREKSLRKLTKMLREKLHINANANDEKETSVADTMVTSVAKARPALQKLSSN